VQLPASIREALVQELEDYLGNISSDPDPESVASYLIEQLEILSDDEGIEDVVEALVESGGLDGSLQDAIEGEMNSNDELEFTGEELVSLLERLCDIEWDDDDDDGDDDEDEEEEEEELAA